MRTWIEINLDNLEYNINKIKELSNNKKIMAIVKADSYGLGAVPIVKNLSEIGVDLFGVSSLCEAIEIREAGIKGEILILYGIFDDELKLAEQKKLQITLTNFSQLEYIYENNIKVSVHIKVDTGMGRVGFSPENAKKALEICKEKQIDVVGIYSHLSDADSDTEESKHYTQNQIKLFKEFEELEDIKYKHILNTSGILKYTNDSKGNVVRPGIMLYGVHGTGKIESLKRVVTMKSKIIFLKELDRDTEISYGRKGKGYKKEMIATITTGYADGLRKSFSNLGEVEIHGKMCQIVGAVCMDATMVKIPNEIKDKVKIGDEVIVIGDDAYEKSKEIGTTAYEIFTGIGRRVVRKFIKKDKTYVLNNLEK